MVNKLLRTIELGEVSLQDYGFRDYSSQVKRFTTIDPIRSGSNWYAYVNNNPINLIDPLGLCPSTSDSAATEGHDYYNPYGDAYSGIYKQPVEELSAHKITVGIRGAIGVGGLIEVGVAWDDKGNIGIVLTVGVGVGVEAALGPSFLPTPSAADEQDITDFEGGSNEAKVSVVVGISYDLDENEIEGIEMLGIGGGVYHTETIVIPLVSVE